MKAEDIGRELGVRYVLEGQHDDARVLVGEIKQIRSDLTADELMEIVLGFGSSDADNLRKAGLP